MKGLLRAIALLSGGSAISLVVGLLSANFSARLIGPGGVGYLGLLQSAFGLATMVALVGGVAAGLVREIGRAKAANDTLAAAAARQAAWWLWGALSALAAAGMLTWRQPLAAAFLGAAEREAAVLPLIVGAVCLLLNGVCVGLLAAEQRIGDLARINVVNSLVAPAMMLPAIWLWREAGLAWAICAANVLAASFSGALAMSHAPAPAARVSGARLLEAAGGLLRFSIPYNASTIAGQGIVLLLPVLVLRALGSDAVGFYRAAAGVSITYLAFLLSSLGQDYYPRVSACGTDAGQLTRLVNEQAKGMMVVAGPIVLVLLALVPYLVPLIYTRQFAPTVNLLEWQLVGDVLKVSGWTMGYAILARSGGGLYFGVELAGGAALLACSWLGLRWLQLEGLGIGFVVSSALSWLTYFLVLKRTTGLRLTRDNQSLLMAFLVTALTIRLLPTIGLVEWRTPIALILAAAGTMASLRIITVELGGLRGMLAWRSVG